MRAWAPSVTSVAATASSVHCSQSRSRSSPSPASEAGDGDVGLLALVGALGAGFTATTRVCGLNAALDVDTTTED